MTPPHCPTCDCLGNRSRRSLNDDLVAKSSKDLVYRTCPICKTSHYQLVSEVAGKPDYSHHPCQCYELRWAQTT